MARKLKLKGFAGQKKPYRASEPVGHGVKRVAQRKRILVTPGRNLASEELIAERRAEAAKETEETLHWLRERKKLRR